MTLRVLSSDEQAVALRVAINAMTEAAGHLRNRVSTGPALRHAVTLESEAAELEHVLGNIKANRKETTDASRS